MKNMFMVRIYVLEAEKLLQPIFSYLHDTIKVSGVTVFRGISGFGKSGELHSSNLLDLSLNLPVAIEFFDQQEKVESAIDYIKEHFSSSHIAYWPVTVPF